MEFINNKASIRLLFFSGGFFLLECYLFGRWRYLDDIRLQHFGEQPQQYVGLILLLMCFSMLFGAIATCKTPQYAYAPFVLILCVNMAFNRSHGGMGFGGQTFEFYGWPKKWLTLIVRRSFALIDTTWEIQHQSFRIAIDWWAFLYACGIHAIICAFFALPAVIAWYRKAKRNQGELPGTFSGLLK